MRGTTLLTVSLLVAAGLPAGAAAAAEPPANIYVSTACGSGGDGSEQAPYCSISAASGVVQPGQTILVSAGDYRESVSIVLPSGEPGKPVTVKGYRGPGGSTKLTNRQDKTPFVLSGVHDVVIDGIDVTALRTPAIQIENSTDITVTNGWVYTVLATGIDITGDSRRVTVSDTAGSAVTGSFVAVGAGSSDTMLVGNSVHLMSPRASSDIAAISVTDAPRTTITNNTIVTECFAGVRITGASSGFGLYNSIVRTAAVGSQPCFVFPVPELSKLPPVSVDGAALADSHLDYNVVNPVAGAPSYSWGGTAYASPAEFNAASGQGAHDIGADAQLLSNPESGDIGWTPAINGPAIDSAWVDAPGRPATDLRGNAHADKPDTTNTGGGFVDRGAVELVPTPTYTTTLSRVRGGGALETSTTVTARHNWTLDGPVGSFAFQAEGQPTIVNRTGTARITFSRAGLACVNVMASTNGFRSAAPTQSENPCVMLGAAFNAVTPGRVLSTKAAIGTTRTTPLAPREAIDLVLPGPAAKSSAVVLNVTVTNPTTNGYLKVYPSNENEPVASNINFAANQTIPNLVTVPVVNGRVRILNGSAGTVHVLADLAGYYANIGLGLTSGTPARVLDTRSAVGVPGTTPIGPNGRVTVDLSPRIPAGTTAVLLNVAVTKPTAGGHLTAFPPGSAIPTTSNLNFVSGQTANNMVIAPVVDGKISFAYGGSGTVHVLADLSGYFAPGVADTFVPLSPRRLFDSRKPGYMKLGPGMSGDVRVEPDECDGRGCTTTAAVLNLTVTGTLSPGYLTVYPDGQPRPTASVLNFGVNETIANLVTVGLHDNKFRVYNSSAREVDLVIDLAGVYISPPA
ncbi:DUF1565 domain-containing protein [Asanoa ishikariensis]|nr:right-handed parallel beta-helix repeat-containing protein [Asanoa ishikariensis]